MARQIVHYTVEILDENIILVKFKNNYIISKETISTIFKIISEQFKEYPLLIDISNIDGIDYDALEFCKVNEVQSYSQRIAFVYNQSNISRKYAMLLSNVNDHCSKMRPFSQYSAAAKWAVS